MLELAGACSLFKLQLQERKPVTAPKKPKYVKAKGTVSVNKKLTLGSFLPW